jgi:thiosulfate/3-mercaptopyruvate sulfurtransferase
MDRAGHGHRTISRRAVLGGVAAGFVLTGLACAAAGQERLEAYAREDLLVDPSWLQQRLDSESLLPVGFMPPDEFAAGHIPGSVQIDWPELELADTSDASVASWETSVAAIVGGLGITLETDVMVYDNGTLFASRLWWVLHYLGHQRLHLLNGGLPAWIEAGDEIAEGEASPTPADPYTGSSDPNALAQLDEVLDALDRDDVVFVDARTEAEFSEGHIPGAVNINYPLNAAEAPPRLWLPEDDLLALYENHGVTPDKLVIPYCSSGVRSAVTAFTLHLIGFDRVALYTGSWNEWDTHPDTPKETGTPT